MDYIGVGRRFAASIIDGIVLMVIMYVIAAATGGTTSDGFSLQGAPVFIGLGIWVLYYIGLEATTGATLGKLALGIRVTKADGSGMDWVASITRNVLRIVDGLFVYLVGAILIWNSPKRQRLGDRVAGTVVVRRASQPAPVSAIQG
jgi:uncharacterized RDD family membrane protein YckC